jgi:pyruvate dehydrogenase E1 component
VVVLAQTKKGYGMGQSGQGRMTTHQQKKLEREDLIAFRNRFALPLDRRAGRRAGLLPTADDAPEMRYLRQRRARSAGPTRRAAPMPGLVPVPPLATLAGFALQADGKEMSTTMAFVRLLGALLKDPAWARAWCPSSPTRRAPSAWPTCSSRSASTADRPAVRAGGHRLGAELPRGADGQILEEGISEAGALASWTAAATSYSVHGQPMLPFYIYYSMFGFQRVGDLIWAAADQRARGFLLGATAGRTTLGGEGLQHQDGHSVLVAAQVPNCRVWDPATPARWR